MCPKLSAGVHFSLFIQLFFAKQVKIKYLHTNEKQKGITIKFQIFLSNLHLTNCYLLLPALEL